MNHRPCKAIPKLSLSKVTIYHMHQDVKIYRNFLWVLQLCKFCFILLLCLDYWALTSINDLIYIFFRKKLSVSEKSGAFYPSNSSRVSLIESWLVRETYRPLKWLLQDSNTYILNSYYRTFHRYKDFASVMLGLVGRIIFQASE